MGKCDDARGRGGEQRYFSRASGPDRCAARAGRVWGFRVPCQRSGGIPETHAASHRAVRAHLVEYSVRPYIRRHRRQPVFRHQRVLPGIETAAQRCAIDRSPCLRVGSYWRGLSRLLHRGAVLVAGGGASRHRYSARGSGGLVALPARIRSGMASDVERCTVVDVDRGAVLRGVSLALRGIRALPGRPVPGGGDLGGAGVPAIRRVVAGRRHRHWRPHHQGIPDEYPAQAADRIRARPGAGRCVGGRSGGCFPQLPMAAGASPVVRCVGGSTAQPGCRSLHWD